MLTRLLSAFALASMLFALPVAAAEVKVRSPVPYADGAKVRDAVRQQCELGEKVASFLAESNGDVKLVESAGRKGSVLHLEITQVHASGGGVWSGPKWMTVMGTLKKNGKTVSRFRAKRYSTGGVFGGFKGTCSIIGRCARAIGQDIGAWLQNPQDGALLGDAKGSLEDD
ncbi:MAG: hypothetical protein QNK04_21860 [Myxococcota bacterium]|nr:hypothetical protein [Myxococcota bacterium]